MAAPAWLLLGPEVGEKADFLSALRSELSAKAGGALEESRAWVTDTAPGALVSSLMNSSLFSPLRLVVYSGVEGLGSKTAAAPLVQYLANPARDAVLVMLSDEVTIEKSLKDAVGAANTKVFWELFEDRKEEWIRYFFRKEGIGIDQEAVEAILELVENDTASLRSECARLALFVPKGSPVTGEIIETWLSHNRSEDAFSLFDRMASGGLREALESLEKILFSKEGEPIAILAGLQWCFRKLEAYQRNLAAGMGQDEAFTKAGIRKMKQKNYRQAAATFPPAACRAILSRIVDTDSLLRSSGSVSDKLAMQTFVYQAMKSGGRKLAVFD